MKKDNLKSNLIFSLITQILTYLFPLIISPYLSRVLGPENIGINTFVKSLSSYFVYFIAFGFIGYGTRKIAIYSSDKNAYSCHFWSIFISKQIFFILSVIVYLLLFYVFNLFSEYHNFLLVYISLLLAESLNISFLFQGLEKFKIVSILNIVFRFSSLIFMFIFVKNEADLLNYMIIYCIQVLGISLAMMMILPKFISKPVIDIKTIKESIKGSLLFFLPTFSIFLASTLDITILGIARSKLEVGFYEETNKIITMVVGVIVAVAPVMLSRMSKLSNETDNCDFSNKLNMLFNVFLFFIIP